MRVDLWAWAVRLFKTRTIAAAACKKSHILINGQRCRAAKQVRVGDEIKVRQGLLTRTVVVGGILKRRVSAKDAPDYLIDLTPESEYLRVAEIVKEGRESAPRREAGAGRPTKRDRREIEEFGGESAHETPSFEEFVKAFVRRR